MLFLSALAIYMSQNWTQALSADALLLLLLSRFSRVQLCATRDGSPPGCPIPEILQARTLERVAISFSRAKLGKEQIKLRLFTDDMIINEENPKGSIKILKLVITARLQDSRSTYRSQLLLGLPRPHD